MLNPPELCGRVGLARILNVAEGTTRAIERRGEIAPVMRIGGRPLYLVSDAEALRAAREGHRQDGDGQAA